MWKKEKKKRIWMPKTRAEKFSHKNEKRQKTRSAKLRNELRYS